MAAAAAEFAEACIRGLLGEPGVVACAYVDSSLTELPFFASKCVRTGLRHTSLELLTDALLRVVCLLRVRLGRHGADGVLPLGPMNAYERAGMAKMMAELKSSIQKGVEFARKQ